MSETNETLHSDRKEKILKVFTWNILAQKYASFPWEQRLPQIISCIKDENPDVLCLQEVDRLPEISLELKTLGFDFSFSMWKRGENVTACVTFVRTVKRKDQIELKVEETFGEYFEGTSQCYTYVLVNGFYVFNVHLKSKINFSEVRMRQVSELCKCIKKLNDCSTPCSRASLSPFGREECEPTFVTKEREADNVILCGDFNAIPDESCHKIVEDLGLKSCNVKLYTTTYKLSTYGILPLENGKVIPKVIDRVIDYIYVGKNFDVVNIRVKHTREDQKNFFLPTKDYPSDHLYVCVELLIRDRERKRNYTEKMFNSIYYD